MTNQDQSNGPDTNTLLPGGDGILLNAGGQTIRGEGYVPKIRKPYTITKQRERWTEEEHKKFLEALKLYGRAWRKIEEHVGTKSAVQIRSHAQKFFSKVVREANNSNSSSVKPIEIPPPRPKKKPVHPYPRKLVIPVKDMPVQEQSARSTSPNSSVDQEHQSPTSVLYAVASDTVGSTYSSTPEGSSSPVSSNDIVNQGAYFPSGGDAMVQENVSQSDEPVSVKLELFPKVGVFTREGSVKATSTKSLKLFGKTVLLANSEKACSSSLCLGQVLTTKLVDIAVVDADQSLTKPQPMDVGPSSPMPLRAFYGGMPFSFIPFDNTNSTKEEHQEKETQKEGSWSGVRTGSLNAPGNGDKNRDIDTHQLSLESVIAQNNLSPASHSKPINNLKRASSEKYTRAFVPYKRSLSEIGTQSSRITDEDDKTQRTRLCL